MPPLTVENLESPLIFPTEAMMDPLTVSPRAAPAVLRRTFPLTVWASVSDSSDLASTWPFTVRPTNRTPFGRRTVKSIFTSWLSEFRGLLAPGRHSVGWPSADGYTAQKVTPPLCSTTCTLMPAESYNTPVL